MSFLEFLFEYYWYILAVLCVLIVGVIGFLVDSKNMADIKKKQENTLPVDDINSVNISKNNIVSDPLVVVQDESSKDINFEQNNISQEMSNYVPIAQDVNVPSSAVDLKNQNIDNGYSNWQSSQFGSGSVTNEHFSMSNFNDGMPVDVTVNNLPDDIVNLYPQRVDLIATNNNLGMSNVSYVNNADSSSQVTVPIKSNNTENSMISNFSVEGTVPLANGEQQSGLNSSYNNSYFVTNSGGTSVSSMVNDRNLYSSMMNPMVNSNISNSNYATGNVNMNMLPNGGNANSAMDNAANLQSSMMNPTVNDVFTSDSKEPFDISSMFANNQ